jgi:hypothetical protein
MAIITKIDTIIGFRLTGTLDDIYNWPTLDK